MGNETSGLEYRSVSQLGTFSSCGEQYRLEKVVRAPRTPAAWFIQGTAFHAAIELWEATGREAHVSTVLAAYDEAWKKDYDHYLTKEPDINKWLTGGRKKPENDIRDREQRGRDQVLAYIQWAKAQPWKTLELVPGEFAVELPFEVTLNGVTVHGFIDQVVEYPDGGLRVRDLKTGTKLPHWPFQLAVYDVGLETIIGQRAGWGDFYMAKNTDTTDVYNLSRYTPEIIGGWFEAMDKAEKDGIYLPNPGDSCRTCGVQTWCLAMGNKPDIYSPYRKKEEEAA